MKTRKLTEFLSWTIIVLTLFFACSAPEPPVVVDIRVAHDSLYKAVSDSLDSVSGTFTNLPIDSEMKVKEFFDSLQK